MDALLDTSVVIDIYRGYTPSVKWIQSNLNLRLGITPIDWMEVAAGAENKSDQRKIVKLLESFSIAYLTETDMNWAMQRLQLYHLSNNVGILDCLVAAPSYRLQLPLYTRNLKHFSPLLGKLAQKPY